MNALVDELKWQKFLSPVVLMTDCSTSVLILQHPTCLACQPFHPTARIPARGEIFAFHCFTQSTLYSCTDCSWPTPSCSSGRKTRLTGFRYWNSHFVHGLNQWQTRSVQPLDWNWMSLFWRIFRGYPAYQYPGGNSYPTTGALTHYPTQTPVSTVGTYLFFFYISFSDN